MHRFMDGSCSNCNKFSHCCNNDLICISKYREKEQECEELKQTLTEIKEIAEEEVHTRMLFADKKSFCDFNKILQKISECEVKNER